MNITIELNTSQSILETNDFYEQMDVSILDKLINSTLLLTTFHNPLCGSVYENEKQQLQTLKKLIRNGKLKVSYRKPKYGLGRVYPLKSLSLCSLRREIRQTLAFDKYVDIDIANCHPEILNQICIHNKIKTRYLKQYIENRESILEQTQSHYDCSRDEAKRLYIILAYYGSIEVWKKTDKEPFDFILDFQNELKAIGSKIIEANPAVVMIVKKENKKNVVGSAVSIILQEKERKILECVYDYLVSKKVIVNNDCALCFDGIMVPKNKYYSSLLEELSNIVCEKLQFKLTFTEKEMTQHYLNDLSAEVDKESFEYRSSEFEKTHCKIINKSIYIKRTEDDNIFLSKRMLKEAYEHITCGETKTGLPRLFIDQWVVGNDSIRSYDSFDIIPHPLKCPDNFYNLWTPFEAEKLLDNYTNNNKALLFILNHVSILCNNDVDVAEYFIKWIGQMIQYPAIKTICPTMISNEGAGKGTLNKLIQKMLGAKKCMETTNPSRDVWGQYNHCMTNAFFINLNELSKKDTLEAEGKIKALITDGNLWVNPKGVNQFEIKSYHRFFITTNKLEPISTSTGDRRNLIIRTSDELCEKNKKNIEYFKTLHKYLDDKDVIATCYDYFKKIPNLDKFNEIPIPKTEYQENLKQLELSPPEQYIKSLVVYDKQDSIAIDNNNLYKNFSAWCAENNIDYDITPLKLAVRLSNLNIKGVSKKKTRLNNLTVLDVKEVRKHFKIDQFIDDDEDEEPVINIETKTKSKNSFIASSLDIGIDSD